MISPRRTAALVCTVLSLYLVNIPAIAAEHGQPIPVNNRDFTEEDFLGEIPMVLTPTRLAQPLLEVPAAISIIDREMIHTSGARNIAELFRLVPGFLVNHEDGHTPIVMYHGLSDEYVKRMQVLIDGRSIYSPVFGGASWTNLPISIHDIERIEIVRGPNSASYGSNSFLAMVNIITQNSAETKGASVQANRGDNGIADTYARLGSSLSNLDYRFSFERSSDNGFSTREDDYYMNRLVFRGDYNVDPSTTLLAQFGAAFGTREVDSKTLQTTTDRNIDDHFQQLRWTHQLDVNQEISMQFFRNVEKQDQSLQPAVPGLGLVDFDFSFAAERYDMEFQHTRQWNPSLRTVWGLGYRQDTAEGGHIFYPELPNGMGVISDTYHNDISKIFGNAELRITNKFITNLGATIEKSDIVGIEASPRLGLNYLFTPSQSFRMVGSRATRSPNINESYSNYRIPISGIPSQPVSFITSLWAGDDDLDAEEITAYEIGYHLNDMNKNFEIDVKAFREIYRGLIAFDENKASDPNDFVDFNYGVYDNLIDATAKGIEMGVNINPRPDLRLIMSYSYTILEDDKNNLNEIDITKSVPKHLASILLVKRMNNGSNASLNYYRATEYDGLGSGKPLPDYDSLNVRLSAPLDLFGAEGNLAVVFKNIGAEHYDWRDENLVEEYMYITVGGQWH